FWDFGGGVLTDLMVHWMDTVHWMLGVDPPTQAMTIGTNFRTAGLWETPDSVQTLLTFGADGLQAHFEGGFVNRYRGSMLALQGDRATLYLDRGRYELTPQPGSDIKPRKLVLGERPPGADWYPKNEGSLPHLRNWLACVRSRKQPNCPAEEGVRSAVAAHLANRALREGGTAQQPT
ncbi:MAG: Gfo/Idh/MocA family oxidoreductase, partial [Planctomycetota bacterium]